MIKIIEPRGAGKTTKLIQQSAESGNYIVCYDCKEVYAIAKQAREMNLHIPFPLTYHEFLQKKYFGAGIKGFLIDNADHLIQALTPVKINGITMTLDNDNNS